MAAKIRVLCVDDDPNAVRSITDLLERNGCEVRGCGDGPAALAAVDGFRPDVCLVDLTLPGMTGDELAVQVRERAGTRPVRLVALTARMDPDSHHRSALAGFEVHLVKPVDAGRLLEVVTAV